MKSTTEKEKKDKKKWHQKIADARGAEWIESLKKGKITSQLNPSKIRLERLRLGIDQAQMASELKMTTSTYGAIERGKQKVRLDRAREIARRLKSQVQKLFSETKSTNSDKKKYIAIIQKEQL